MFDELQYKSSLIAGAHQQLLIIHLMCKMRRILGEGNSKVLPFLLLQNSNVLPRHALAKPYTG
jgi:hypothetical protein